MVLSADNPIEATCGYSVFRIVDWEGNPAVTDTDGNYLLPPEERMEQACLYVWPAFGKFLEPKVSIVENAEEMILFLARYPDAKPAHSPVDKRIGFAYYDMNAGISLVCQIQSDVLKASEDRYKGPILERSRNLGIGNKQVLKSSDQQKRAAALAGTLRLQAGAGTM